VTKRTERLGLAALLVLALSGCGGSPNKAADYQPAPVAAQQAEAQQAEATSAPPSIVESAAATTSAPPVVTTKTVTETKSIAYATTTVKDSSVAKGVRKTRTKGVAGIRTFTYQVTYTGGRQTAKKLVKSVVTRKPVSKVVAVGTKAASSCDPNYTGACVPIASDVDCAGGSGNGPAYVTGPVKVVGTDIYDLDRDGDGTACD
jgi:hypothetical protein